MEFTSVKRVAIKSLKLPGDIKERKGKAHVIKLAASFVDTGGEPGNMPWIRNSTREVVAGRDRIAAAMVNKLTHLWCRFGHYTDEEARRAERTENLWRRQDNREKLLAEAVKEEQAAREAALKAADKEAAEKAKAKGTPVPPPKKALKKETREAVAKKAGVKPESVRKAEQRSRKKEAAPPKAEKGTATIETYGHAVPRALHGVVVKIQEGCSGIEQASKAAQTIASKLANILPAPVLARILDAAKELGAVARSVRPQSICPQCRAEGTEKCPTCKGAHYARQEQMANVPKEWLEPKPAVNGVHEAQA